MRNKMPQVREFMTPAPYAVESDTKIQKARELMPEHGIRHLPVRRNGSVIGIVSDRNLKEAYTVANADRLAVTDVMIPEPYSVPPETPLDDVAAGMAEEKFGCVVIEDASKKLVGIFTTVDACRALRQLLETHYES